MARLVIFGAGDIARLAHHYFTRDSSHDVVGFVTDREHRRADSFLGLPWVEVGQLRDRFPTSEHEAFVAISYARMNRVRAEKYALMRDAGYRLATYISSRCSYLSESLPGDNCFILEDNTIQPFVTVGSNVTLWSGNHIGHDSRIDDHCFISSHVVISGHVRVGAYSFIGVNATLRNSITIGEASLIGAGALDHEGHTAALGVRAGSDEGLPEVERRDRPVSWRRLGPLRLDTAGVSWAATHAALPVAEPVDHGVWNLYLSLRDEQGRARIGRATLTFAPTPQLTPLDPEPVLDLGVLGAFDDSGVVGSCLVNDGDRRLLYYTGWARGVTVPFYLTTGVAISTDGDRFSADFRRTAARPQCGGSVSDRVTIRPARRFRLAHVVRLGNTVVCHRRWSTARVPHPLR